MQPGYASMEDCLQIKRPPRRAATALRYLANTVPVEIRTQRPRCSTTAGLRQKTNHTGHTGFSSEKSMTDSTLYVWEYFAPSISPFLFSQTNQAIVQPDDTSKT